LKWIQYNIIQQTIHIADAFQKAPETKFILFHFFLAKCGAIPRQ
jgi:hypothetical protein